MRLLLVAVLALLSTILLSCSTSPGRAFSTEHYTMYPSDVICAPEVARSFVADTSANVIGQVRSAHTSHPILNAPVSVVNASTSTTTQWCGYFFLHLPAGEHELRIRSVGYPDFITPSLSVPKQDSTLVLNIYMGPLLVE